MANLRILCEKYIQIDEEINQLYDKIDVVPKPERDKLVAEYLQKYMRREDFKSGMRTYLINELVRGVGER
ncbi:hypothetical protein [Methanobrevibacter sp.]|jgi:hypothetical protein|uniref:hypothetical protein n=1 Tax=Methanobrevibacter sp. TaxID=66852 RepID=UPI0038670C9E